MELSRVAGRYDNVCLFPRYAGYRFAAEVISHAVWLYFRFPLSLRTLMSSQSMRSSSISAGAIATAGAS